MRLSNHQWTMSRNAPPRCLPHLLQCQLWSSVSTIAPCRQSALLRELPLMHLRGPYPTKISHQWPPQLPDPL